MKWTIGLAAYLVIACGVACSLGRLFRSDLLHTIPAEWLDTESDLPCLHCSGKVSPMQTLGGWLVICNLCGTALPAQEYQVERERERSETAG